MKNFQTGERVRLLFDAKASAKIIGDSAGSVVIHESTVKEGSIGEVIGFRSEAKGVVLFRVCEGQFRVQGGEYMFDRA